MQRKNLMVQLFGVAFVCLSFALTSSASRKEELERAAELAVERTAERVAERAVEKALESGNSSSETETIRVAHSSVRKYDASQKLPGFVYTPAMRREYERIAKEKEAGELAVAQIMRGQLFKRAIVDENYKYKDSRVKQDNDNIFSHGNLHSEKAEINHHENPIKSVMHPVTVSEVTEELTQFYPFISYYQKIPIEQTTVSQDKSKDTHHTDIPANTVLYHPIKLFKISQAVPTIHYYHRPSLPPSVRPIYYYPKVKVPEKTHDHTSNY